MGGGAGGEDDWDLFLHQAPVFCTNCPFFSPTARFSPHLHSATQATLSKGLKTCLEPGVSFFIYFMYSMIFTSLSRTAYGPFSTPSSPFMYQPPVFCTNHPFFYQPPVFHPICTQLPRLPFPRGPNDETEFHHLCPRLKMRLEPWVSFIFIFMYSKILTDLFQDAYGPFSTPSSPFIHHSPVYYTNRPSFITNRPFLSPTIRFQHSTARFHPCQHHIAHFLHLPPIFFTNHPFFPAYFPFFFTKCHVEFC